MYYTAFKESQICLCNAPHDIMCFLIKVTGSIVFWPIPMYKTDIPHSLTSLYPHLWPAHLFQHSPDSLPWRSSLILLQTALVYKPNPPCFFTISGTKLATADLHVPTNGGRYYSYLSFLALTLTSFWATSGLHPVSLSWLMTSPAS